MSELLWWASFYDVMAGIGTLVLFVDNVLLWRRLRKAEAKALEWAEIAARERSVREAVEVKLVEVGTLYVTAYEQLCGLKTKQPTQ